MRRILTPVLASIAATLLVISPVGATHAAGWGWGQLKFSDLPGWQSEAVVETLVTARAQGLIEARRGALQPLVDQKVITGDQANLVATSPSNAIIAALVKSGGITKPQAMLVRKALAGTNGWPAKQAAVRIALKSLQDAGLLTAEQAQLVQARVLGS